MGKCIAIVAIFCFITAGSLPVSTAHGADIEGSRDHPLLKRYEGSEILKYEQREYDSLTIALGKARSSAELEDSRQVEGTVTRLTYKIPLGRSVLEVVRNYEQELQGHGFTPLFAGGGKDELGNYFAEAAGYKKITWPPNVPALTLNSDSQRFLALEKKGTEGEKDMVVALYGVENRFWASNVKNVEKGQVLFQVDIVETTAMETRMVTVTAEEMARQISVTGSIALYGIYFDTDKAEIKAESSTTLEQIARLLHDNEQLKILVVGHTDNVGSFSYNRELSDRRAASVVGALTSRYSIPAERLTPVGVSFACPVASNGTAEGRAKNRRVELVEH